MFGFESGYGTRQPCLSRDVLLSALLLEQLLPCFLGGAPCAVFVNLVGRFRSVDQHENLALFDLDYPLGNGGNHGFVAVGGGEGYLPGTIAAM